MHLKKYVCLYVRVKCAIIMLKILGATVQNVVAHMINCPRFVNPCVAVALSRVNKARGYWTDPEYENHMSAFLQAV
jgi:hypothetical protein